MEELELIKKYLQNKKNIIQNIYSVIITNIGVYKINNRISCRLNGPKIKKTILYSRLLVEINENRLLNYDETIDHIDGNPSNDNLNNLQILSRSENAKKGPSKIVKMRVSNDNSKRMYLDPSISGEKCNFHKLTEDDVRCIRSVFNGTHSNYSILEKSLSEKYNVSNKTINRIRNNKIWKHII